MATTRFFFEGHRGLRLAAYLEMPPAGEPSAYGVFAHCFTCSKDYKAVVHVSRTLAQEGFAILRLDFAGLGESEGDFAQTTLSSNVEDLLAAARFLEAKAQAPAVLIGHSLGGVAALLSARQLPSVRAVVTLAAPFDPGGSGRFLKGAREATAESGSAEVEIAGRSFRLKKAFFEDLDRVSVESALRDLSKPLLVLHSPSDAVVDIAEGERLFAMARYPKAFVSLDGADHLLSDRADGTYAGAVIAAWLRRFVA